MIFRCPLTVLTLVAALIVPLWSLAGTIRVATYNVENYLDAATESRETKSEASKAKVRESILAIKPDVIAFEEMGAPSALKELQASLKRDGLDLPYLEHVSGGFDTNIFVGVLSRFPFSARRSCTSESFLIGGKRFRVSRGFAWLEIKASESFSFALLAAHLKSKRAVPDADESELRLEEAKLLREKVDAILAGNPAANVVVLGDFNDTRDSRSTRAIIGRGKTKLVDMRPAERNGDNTPNTNPAWYPRNITWTHFYGKEDSYSRIDYIFASPEMAKRWLPAETHILALPNWGVASDHRPIVAGFNVPD
jgi:endonuclease/exonuclease/phosphatase family metal-dependent hydrolase